MNWPWMKGEVSPLVDPPIAPLDEHDNRPAVKDLITTHAEAIEQLRVALQPKPLFDSRKHDELWLLRFVLSHGTKKGLENAIKAAQYTLEFRAQHRLDDQDLRFLPVNNETPNLYVRGYLQHCQDHAIVFVAPHAQRGVLAYLRADRVDQHALVKHVDAADWLQMYLYVTEFSHQWVDYVTRTTGRLTKSVRLVDTEGFGLQRVNRQYMKRNAQVTRILADCYPQLLQCIFPVHCPPLIQAVWRIVRPILPRRVAEKVDFIEPTKHKKDLAKVLQFASEDLLPQRFGGTSNVWPPISAMPPKIQAN